MNTKLILTSSAFVLGIVGIILTFLPTETLLYFNQEPILVLRLIVQITGGFYFAFAMLNWMSKGSLIGGIYNRPVAIANLTHFMIGGLALLKGLMVNSDESVILLLLTTVYLFFGIAFAIIFFRHPADKTA